ncbi:flagellar protein FliS [Alkalidesulfovibrio alkalitolerans DSM 16529]|jgi:flagellar protein FliS|uniref:Flagellar protein FliS n=1 Tax=Alkalidesulfovibrio alkalitolerans DSM 16529 TaxID=1121439 RepID=S7T3B3_9BACT|nr:flagellar export chaperone FliS [Alkalidesulfovibrio alkalitolerans]EPR31086.1 flagellar protein FliS [Alkalidesulfovibrio alkalitolerans DSM 16529]
MHKATRAYIATQVGTTSQADLLILLYDGAMKYLSQAKERIQARDFKGKGQLLAKASDVINELQSSLNKEKGGEIAENLSRLYFYCNSRLLMANLKMDTEAIDQVINILKGLRSAYAEIKGAAETAVPDEQAKAPAKPLSLAAAATAMKMQPKAGAVQPESQAATTGEARAQSESEATMQPTAFSDAANGAEKRPAPESAPKPATEASPQPPRPVTLQVRRAAMAYGNSQSR